MPVARRAVVAGVTVPVEDEDERVKPFAAVFSGYLEVPEDAMYEFSLTSDDGSTLWIGDTKVVDNDGLHGAEERTGMIALRTGPHPIAVRYIQGGGGAVLRLRVRTGTGAWRDVPASWLTHRP